MNRQFRQCNNLGQRLSASLFHDPRLFRFVSLWARSHFSSVCFALLFIVESFDHLKFDNFSSHSIVPLTDDFSRSIPQTNRSRLEIKYVLIRWTRSKSGWYSNQKTQSSCGRIDETSGREKEKWIRSATTDKNQTRTQHQRNTHRNKWNIAPDVDRNARWNRNPKSIRWPPVNLQKSKSTNHHLTFQTSTFNFICLDFLFHPVNHQTSCRSFDKKCPITNGVIQMSVSRKYWRTKPLVKKRFWNQFCWKSKMTHVQWIKVAEYSPTYSIWSECPNVKNLPPSSKLYKYLTSDRYFLWWATRPQQNKNVIEMCPTFLIMNYCWTCCSIVHPYVLNWGCRDIRRERWSLNRLENANTSRFKLFRFSMLWNKRFERSWTMKVS